MRTYHIGSPLIWGGCPANTATLVAPDMLTISLCAAYRTLAAFPHVILIASKAASATATPPPLVLAKSVFPAICASVAIFSPVVQSQEAADIHNSFHESNVTHHRRLTRRGSSVRVNALVGLFIFLLRIAAMALTLQMMRMRYPLDAG